MRRLNLALAMLSAGIGLASPAFAYRPFDGTDGDVADVGEFELEMGPAHFLSSPEGRYIVAPATVLNLGVARGLELVVDFKDFVGLQSVAGQPRMRLLDTDIFLKGILRRGTLQGESGVSIALEAGPLLPELGVFLRGWHWQLLGFVSLILEGPHDWAVRPVGEIYADHEFGNDTTYSALAGAIWQVRDGLALDAAVRYAAQPGNNDVEVRFGLTWGVALWHHEETHK